MQSYTYEPVEKRFESPAELEDHIRKQLLPQGLRFGFRGHADSSWELETTLARFVRKTQKLFPERIHQIHLTQVADTLSRQFKNNLIVNRDLSKDQIDTIDLWQFGQHYGLPSPLLDWTLSPYVGLFFALSDPAEITENLRCIWVIDKVMLKFINDDIRSYWTKKIAEGDDREHLAKQYPRMERVQEISEVNRRSAYQQGFFTKLEHHSSVEAWIRCIAEEIPIKEFAGYPLLQKLTFRCDRNERLEMLRLLDLMNINYRTLFPDIQGTVKDATESISRGYFIAGLSS